jgi:FkbH-like protein
VIPSALHEWRDRNFKDYEVRKYFRSKEIELYLQGPTAITIELAGVSETELLASALQLDFAAANFITRTEIFQYDEWKFLPPTQGADVSVFWLPILSISGGGISIPLELIDQITYAVNARLSNGAATYIMLPEPSVSSAFYADSLEEARKKFNLDLQSRFQDEKNVVFLSWENWLGVNTISSWSAPRFWEIGRMPGSPSLLSHIAKMLGSYIRNDFGFGIKAIAVDLDDTLWSGIVGDQGVESLMLDQFGEGRSHLELQRFLADQHNKGIFLGIVSKNDPAIVKEVFASRSEMLIKESQIAYWGVTWEKKSESIGKMAEALNIHPTSIVFIDDSEFEISEVKGAYPGIRTIHVSENGSSFLEKLQNTGLFQITSKNPTRTVEIEKLENIVGAKQDYQFRVEVRQIALNLDHLERATSLINKTNQFNLTSNRTSRARLWDLAQNPECLVMVYEVDENAQSKGIMSVLVTDNSGDVMRIEDWVLSCRAFSRGVEWWILWNIAKQLDSKGIGLIRCQLNKTDRTSYIENFMEQIQAADLIDLDHNLKIKSILESEFVLNEIRGLVND